jgi:hypothetical protein
MSTPFRCTLLAATLSALVPAHAGRPLQTEDAAVLDRGACEFEASHLRLSFGGTSARETGVGLGCGTGWNSQLGAGLARASASGEKATGFGLGGKTGLWQAVGDAPAELSLAWGLDWERSDGSGWQSGSRFATLVGSLPAGPGSVHVNLGHVSADGAGSTVWNLAWEHGDLDIGGLPLAPMAEVFGDDRGDLWANLALRATLVPERVFIDASWGRQLVSDKARLLTVGFKFSF